MIAFVADWMNPVNITPDWIAACAAVLALGAAIWAGLTSKKLVDVERDRDRKTQERSVREQASHISAWAVYCPNVDESANEGPDGILVHNSSTAPVYDLKIHSLSREGQDQYPLTMTVLPPGDFVALTKPKYHWAFPTQLSEVNDVARPITKHQKWMVSSIEFRDAHGVSWRRTGGLLEIVN